MRRYRGVVILLILFGLAVTLISIPQININALGIHFDRGKPNTPLGLTEGLDLQGGTDLVFQGVHADGSPPTADDMQGVRKIVEQRINQFGLNQPNIQLLGNPPNRLLVQLPGLSGSTINLAFAGNPVTASELQQYFQTTLNHPEATVTAQPQTSGPTKFTISLNSLQPAVTSTTSTEGHPSEADTIRQALAKKYPAVMTVEYPVGGNTSTSTAATSTAATSTSTSSTSTSATATSATSTPHYEAPTVANIQAVLGALNITNATVKQDGPWKYSITLPDLQGQSVDSSGNVTYQEALDVSVALGETFGPPITSSLTGELSEYNVSGGLAQIEALISHTASLEFKERDCASLNAPNANTPWPPDGLTQAEWAVQRCTNPKYYQEKATGLTGKSLKNAYAGTEPGQVNPVVFIQFDSAGAKTFYEVTSRIAQNGGALAIYLDGKQLVAPTAQKGIAGGNAYISGNFTAEQARTIAIQLRSGALPVNLNLIQERHVDATLGQDTVHKSIIAAVIGLALVLIFMSTYYKLPGIVASLALLLYAAILLAAFKMAPVTITLSGIAALVLSIGTAVDANVLISERTKEELRAGRTLFAAINEGFDRAWPSIRDGHMSTLITAVVLFWFGDRLGTSIMQGFALTLAAGTLTSLFSAFVASRIISRALARTWFGRRLTMWVPTGGVGLESAAEPGD